MHVKHLKTVYITLCVKILENVLFSTSSDVILVTPMTGTCGTITRLLHFLHMNIIDNFTSSGQV